MRIRLALAIATISLSSCGSKDSGIRDDWAPAAGPLPAGRYDLGHGRSLDVHEGGSIYRSRFRAIEIEASDPAPSPAREETAFVEGGVRYRIRSVSCSPRWALCEGLKTAQHLYVTPGRVTQINVLRPATPRGYDGIRVQASGGEAGFAVSAELGAR